jgi:hypothetical protein
MAKKLTAKQADKKYANGTKYKDPDGKTRTRKNNKK